MDLRMHRQVGALWKVLSQQAIGILVRPALPRALRVAKIDIDVGCHSKAPMIRQFLTPVPGQGLVQLFWQLLRLLDECVDYRPGVLACYLGQHHVTFDARLRSRCRCCSARTADRPPNGQAPPDLQPQPVADGLRRHLSYVPVYHHSDQPVWSDASSASIEDGEAALS